MTTIGTHHRALIAVFSSEEEAMRAHSALGNSIDPKHVAIIIDLTWDGIAAEAPGQAYENQGDAQDLWQLFKWGIAVDPETEDARVLADVERGSVVLTVDPLARSNRALVVCILKEHRAIAIRGVRRY